MFCGTENCYSNVGGAVLAIVLAAMGCLLLLVAWADRGDDDGLV